MDRQPPGSVPWPVAVVVETGAHDVQVKAYQGVAGDKLTGAAFAPMASQLEVGTLPDYLVGRTTSRAPSCYWRSSSTAHRSTSSA